MENEKTTKTEKKTAGSCPSAMTCYQFFFPLYLSFLLVDKIK